MATLAYGTKANLTITLASLANASIRCSVSVSNDSNGYIDVLVGGKVTTDPLTSTGDYIDVYAAGSIDGGTTFSGDATGTDVDFAGVTENLKFVGRIATESASTTYEFGPFSLASAFGGTVPEDWCILIDNESDDALDSVAGGHEVHYQGITTA